MLKYQKENMSIKILYHAKIMLTFYILSCLVCFQNYDFFMKHFYFTLEYTERQTDVIFCSQ